MGRRGHNPGNMAKGKDLLFERLKERLIALRDENHLTDTGWARAAGEVQQEVSRFTTNEMKFPRLDFLDNLARVFHRTLPDLLAEDVPPATLTESQVQILSGLKSMKPSERAHFEGLVRGKAASGTGRRRGSRADRQK
jgi:hypothetical protein